MIDPSGAAPAALRSATVTGVSAVIGGDAPLTADDEPKEKGEVITEHYEIPEPVGLTEFPDIHNPGPDTFVLSPENLRG